MPVNVDKHRAVYWLSKLTDSVLVGVSGGKDSVATLELCRQAGLKMTGYFMYFVKDLRYQTEYLNFLRDKYKMEIHLYPHPDRVMCLRDGRYCIPQSQLPNISFRDVWETARKDTGQLWIATGEKKVDSLERRAQLVSWGAVQPARHRGFPIAEWKNKDVFEFLEKNRIPLAPEYADLGKSIGALLEGQALDWIKTRYPDDYRKLLADFPLAEAARIRHLAKGGANG